ncbi:MAG: YceI family protein [Acidobacteriota bacterium]
MKVKPPRARRAAVLLAALAVAACPTATAAEMGLKLDPDSTSIRFALGATLHTVQGEARMREGAIRFDPDSGAVSGRIVVSARSATTHKPSRDKHMHADVLESEEFPEIVFSPHTMQGDLRPEGESRVRISGTLEIHGAVHDVTWPVNVSIEGDSLKGSMSFTVPYVQWGMKDPSIFVLRVHKEVEVIVMFQGVLEEENASPPP